VNEITLPCSLIVGDNEVDLEAVVKFSRTEEGVKVHAVAIAGVELDSSLSFLEELAEDVESLYVDDFSTPLPLNEEY